MNLSSLWLLYLLLSLLHGCPLFLLLSLPRLLSTECRLCFPIWNSFFKYNLRMTTTCWAFTFWPFKISIKHISLDLFLYRNIFLFTWVIFFREKQLQVKMLSLKVLIFHSFVFLRFLILHVLLLVLLIFQTWSQTCWFWALELKPKHSPKFQVNTFNCSFSTLGRTLDHSSLSNRTKVSASGKKAKPQ